jgi:broad specificity phosphatase PhoE
VKRLYLIRHGETDYNKRGIGLGRTDVALTEHGARQAEALGRKAQELAIDRVYSSPLRRCLATAQQVVGTRDIPVEHREELLELDVGETEGLPFPEMRERFGDFIKRWAGPEGAETPMPGGESLREVHARLLPFVEHVYASPDETVAIVSHNFVTRVLLTQLLGMELAAFRSFNVDLASLTTVTLRDRRAVIGALNCRCHLRTLEP